MESHNEQTKGESQGVRGMNDKEEEKKMMHMNYIVLWTSTENDQED